MSTTSTDYGQVLLDLTSGNYWTLNATAAVALTVMLKGGSTAEAAQALVEDYAVDPAKAQQDVVDLVTELKTADLLEANPTEGLADTEGRR